MAVPNAPSGAMDAGDGFELLGVLLMAYVLADPGLAMDEVHRFAAAPGVVQSNSVTFTETEGGVVVRADVRAGCETFRPGVTLLGRTLPDSVAVAAAGSRLGSVIGCAWLDHPDLIIEVVEPRANGTAVIHLVPTVLDARRAADAIGEMRHAFPKDRRD